MGREYSVPAQERQWENSVNAHLRHDNNANYKGLSAATDSFAAHGKTFLGNRDIPVVEINQFPSVMPMA
jgi:hypothetical protein